MDAKTRLIVIEGWVLDKLQEFQDKARDCKDPIQRQIHSERAESYFDILTFMEELTQLHGRLP